MAVVSHSVANPTHKSIRRRFDLRKSISKRTLDIYGKKQPSQRRISYPDYKAITSASKGVPDFKEQDFIWTKTLVQKRAYYSASKMTYAQAGTKADEVVSYGVTSSGAYDTDTLHKSLNQSGRGGTIPWVNITNISSATSVQSGEFNIRATKNGTSTWELARPVLWFDLDGLMQDNIIKGLASNTNFNSGSMSIPRRCAKCNREYHTYRDRAELYVEYLAKDVFGNIPMEREDCLECQKQSAQLAAVQ